VGASVALVAFAIHDYSRRSRPLLTPSRLLHPRLPVTVAACPCPANGSGKSRRAA